MKLTIDGIEYIPGSDHEGTAETVKTWYDRHLRHWAIWAEDAEGNQIGETRYGFGKAEALRIKREIEEEYGI